jgi:hypothetical protein
VRSGDAIDQRFYYSWNCIRPDPICQTKNLYRLWFFAKDLNYGLNVVAPCAGFHTAVYQKPKFGRGLVTFITQLIVCRVGQFDHDLHVRKSSRLVSEVSPLHQSSNRFKRSALLITDTELNVMATLAITGLRSTPKNG